MMFNPGKLTFSEFVTAALFQAQLVAMKAQTRRFVVISPDNGGTALH
jgi:hypothetical protein